MIIDSGAASRDYSGLFEYVLEWVNFDFRLGKSIREVCRGAVPFGRSESLLGWYYSQYPRKGS